MKDNPYPLVEAAGLEPTVSSTRIAIFMFFEHHCLHIVRIFHQNTLFCTLFPLFPYRKVAVVVSYVVKTEMTLKSRKRRAIKSLFAPLTNHTRVKKYARNIHMVYCILTLKRKKARAFDDKNFASLRQRIATSKIVVFLFS